MRNTRFYDKKCELTKMLKSKNAPAVSVNSIQIGLFRKLVRLGGRGEAESPALFTYISAISSAKSVIQGCIEKEFHTLYYAHHDIDT